MKIALFLIMCSSVANTCMAPFVHETTFDNRYDCLLKGYQMSIDKIVEIGKADINEHGIYVKFECQEYILPQKNQQNTSLLLTYPRACKTLLNHYNNL